MDADKIIVIVSTILTVAIFAWGLYSKVKGNAAEAVSGLIAAAEETDLLGKEKMSLVVGWLFDMIPAPLKKVFTKDFLEKLAQKIFDYMKKYANAYIESKKGKAAFDQVNKELAAEFVEKLKALGPVGLKALAVDLGIDVAEKTEADLIVEIVKIVLGKIN